MRGRLRGDRARRVRLDVAAGCARKEWLVHRNRDRLSSEYILAVSMAKWRGKGGGSDGECEVEEIR
jgi:hypothetical protein